MRSICIWHGVDHRINNLFLQQRVLYYQEQWYFMGWWFLGRNTASGTETTARSTRPNPVFPGTILIYPRTDCWTKASAISSKTCTIEYEHHFLLLIGPHANYDSEPRYHAKLFMDLPNAGEPMCLATMVQFKTLNLIYGV